MRKESLAWLILRVIGLVLLGFALLQLSYLPGNLAMLQVIHNVTDDYARISGVEARVFSNIFNAIVLAVLAAYFLRRGDRVHGWLMREGKSNEQA